MLKTSLLIVVLGVTGCGSGRQPGAKSVFALTAADFDDAETHTVSSAASVGPVEKGDLLFISASGTLATTTAGMVGPDGVSAWGGSSYALVNRPVFALFGRVNQSVFFIGREAVVIVPESGTLELLVNGCASASCSSSGSFSAAVHSKLGAGVTLATTPALTDNSTVSTASFAVNAASGWQPTGVQLSKGQKTFVNAGGTFDAGGKVVGAGGTTGIGGTSFQLTNRPVHRLFGRVDGTIIELGAQAAFLAPAAGELELVINHRGDTSGTLPVTIAQGVVPARGILQLEAGAFGQSATLAVSATGVAHSTSVMLVQGDPVLVTATGAVGGSEPWGDAAVAGSGYAVPSRPVMALYGRVAGETFYLGGAAAVLAPATGPLELLINAPHSCATAGACAGSFSVDVKAR